MQPPRGVFSPLIKAGLNIVESVAILAAARSGPISPVAV
jgi:hypothetical protein